MKTISLIFICFCFKINAQVFNNLTQMGLNGKIKTIINYSYDSQFYDNKWNVVAISDKNNWKRHYEYHFLENGNFDSMYFESQLQNWNNEIVITNRKYLYGANKMVIQKGGYKYAIDTFKLKILSDTSYQEDNIDIEGLLNRVITKLNKKGRLESTRSISYDSSKKITGNEFITYMINKDNLCTKIITKDLITNKTKTDEFIVLETDISENPKKTKVITTNYDGRKTQYLLIREYKYYNEINYFEYVNNIKDSFNKLYESFDEENHNNLSENEKLLNSIKQKDSTKLIFIKAQITQGISKKYYIYIQAIKDSSLQFYTQNKITKEFLFDTKTIQQYTIKTIDDLITVIDIEKQKDIRNKINLPIELIEELTNDSPLAGTMALLTKFQNDIKSLEVAVLKELASKLK